MIMNNHMELHFPSRAENEALARVAVSALFLPLHPSMSFLSEIRTAVSEAVTNAVVHAYPGEQDGMIILRAKLDDQSVQIDIEDYGCGIADIRQAMQPFFTTQPEKERTGMGFSLMQSFMDSVSVVSTQGSGTLVSMKKYLEVCHEIA